MADNSQPVVQDIDQGRTGTTNAPYKFASISASASGATEVVAAVTGKKIRVHTYTYVCNAAVNVKFQSATTDKTGLEYCGANGGVSATWAIGGHFETAVGEALNINLSGNVAVGGHLTYTEV